MDEEGKGEPEIISTERIFRISRTQCYWILGVAFAGFIVVFGIFLLVTINLMYRPPAEIKEAQNSTNLSTDPYTRARQLASLYPIIDGHNDLPWRLRELSPAVGREFEKIDLKQVQTHTMTDIPRCRAGGLAAQFWSVYVPCSTQENETAVKMTMQQIDIVQRMIQKYPDDFMLVLSAEDLLQSIAKKKIGSLIGMEGGHSIASSLSILRQFYSLGVRYMTLTHTCNTPWAECAQGVPMGEGKLSSFGESVVREMNRLGMLVDISHVSDGVMRRVFEISAAPVIFSHSSARHLCNHVRNVPDDVLLSLPANGGIIMINMYPVFVKEEVRRENERLHSLGLLEQDIDAALKEFQQKSPDASTIKDVANHIDYVKSLIGVDYIGFGGDFDGIDFTTNGLEDVSKYPDLIAELIRRGYTDDELRKIMGFNLIRVLIQAEKISGLLKMEPLHDEI